MSSSILSAQENATVPVAPMLPPALPQSNSLPPVISAEAEGSSPSTSQAPSTDADVDFINFVNTYAEYADVIEAPRVMHEVVGMQLIAAILNKNGVTIPLGPSRLTFDLWTLLVSGSGGGRSTLISIFLPVLKAAGLEDLIKNKSWGSAEGLYQDLAENPVGLFSWGEFSEKMRMLNDPRFGSAKPWITDRYDNSQIPETHKYRRTSKPGTPSITFTKAPRTNFLATSSQAWLFSYLSQEDSSGGFMPRWTILRADGPVRSIPVPQAPDERLVEPLATALKEVDQLSGEADISQILPLYEQWYEPAKTRFHNRPNSELGDAYFNRHRIHILKLAVIFEVSRSRSLCVTPESWERAVAFARVLETAIFSMVDTGMNADGYLLAKMAQKILAAGPEGLRQSDFTRAFQHMKAMDRKNMLQTLVEAEIVKEGELKTGGRKCKVLIHLDHNKAIRERREAQLAALNAPPKGPGPLPIPSPVV